MSEPELKEAAEEVAKTPEPEDLGEGFTLVHSDNGAMTVTYRHGSLNVARGISDRSEIKSAIQALTARVERLNNVGKPKPAPAPKAEDAGDGVTGE